MDHFLRTWRQEAVNKHQNDTAIFIGDKLLALTNNDKDAFWLAQVHFNTGNYTRAQSFLQRQNLIARNPSCKYLAALCNIRQGKYDDALSVLGETNPVHLISTASNPRRKLSHIEITARNGLPKNVKSGHRMDRIERSEEREREDIKNIRFEAAMCYLRGLCFAKHNAFDRAKQCYKEAVRIDVQCFEAFDQLMKNQLLAPDEEWEFLDSLDFDSITISDDASTSQQAGEFTKLLYTTRLSKYKNSAGFIDAAETLSTHYSLSQNPDLLLSKADLLFTQCRFSEALSLTESILERDMYNLAVLPIHLSCLHELRRTNTLFLLSHTLADSHPEEPGTWLAVGTYYLTIGKIAEARRYFSKASMMDPHFGAAWIGFAHTFAAEGEHDQAISAYSTAARLFQGTHLPQLYLGMQNLLLGNISLAHDYLQIAHGLCGDSDPLLMNELGVVLYHQELFEDSVDTLRKALELAEDIEAEAKAWLPTRTNLGHSLRRLSRWREAIAEFDEVLRLGGPDASVFCSKSLCLLELGECWMAVVTLHEALSISPQDPIATELLGKALEETALGVGGSMNGDGGDGPADRAVETAVGKRRVVEGGVRRSERRKARVPAMTVDDESMAID